MNTYFLNWYRLNIAYDTWRPRDVGTVFAAEGTARMAALEAGGFVEQVGQLGSEELPNGDEISKLAQAVAKQPPRGTTVKRKRRGTVEAVPTGGEDVREEPGDAARGEDGPAGGDGSETSGPDTETGPAA